VFSGEEGSHVASYRVGAFLGLPPDAALFYCPVPVSQPIHVLVRPVPFDPLVAGSQVRSVLICSSTGCLLRPGFKLQGGWLWVPPQPPLGPPQWVLCFPPFFLSSKIPPEVFR